MSNKKNSAERHFSARLALRGAQQKQPPKKISFFSTPVSTDPSDLQKNQGFLNLDKYHN